MEAEVAPTSSCNLDGAPSLVNGYQHRTVENPNRLRRIRPRLLPPPHTLSQALSGAHGRRRETMGSRLGRRVIHFANLPIKLLMPSPPFDSIREIALKTIPSATKVEIRRVLESLYGFEVAEVRTLNMEGKKIKRGPFLAAKPDYKKAYVTLRSPLSLSPDLFPIPLIQEERERIAAAQAKSRPTVVEGEDGGKGRRHWLDERREEEGPGGRGRYGGGGGRRRGGSAGGRGAGKKAQEESKFPWSSMRLSSK